MTQDEHAAARACGVAIRPGMLVWRHWQPKAPGLPDAFECWRVTLVARGMCSAERCGIVEDCIPLDGLAPALTEGLTYVGALRQWAVRQVAAAEALDCDAEVTVLELLLRPDPASLAALLRATAPGRDGGGP